jgi:hypothetical protein
MAKKYQYIVSPDGIIFRKSKKGGIKEVPKRIGSRGYLVFRCNAKEISYKRFVAQNLIPNPNDCDKVFSNDGDQWNTHPTNLRWVWTREKRILSPFQALQKTKDSCLIDFYKTGDYESLRIGIIKAINNLHGRFKNQMMGELYLKLNNYADRCLLFDLKMDTIGTYIGLVRQEQFYYMKNLQLNENKEYYDFYSDF